MRKTVVANELLMIMRTEESNFMYKILQCINKKRWKCNLLIVSQGEVDAIYEYEQVLKNSANFK